MNGQNRKDIYRGLQVDIILKKDQRSGNLTRGFVKDLLTSSAFHSRGIKVRLEDGQIGRVAHIVEEWAKEWISEWVRKVLSLFVQFQSPMTND